MGASVYRTESSKVHPHIAQLEINRFYFDRNKFLHSGPDFRFQDEHIDFYPSVKYTCVRPVMGETGRVLITYLTNNKRFKNYRSPEILKGIN